MTSKKPTAKVLERNTRKLSDEELQAVAGGLLTARFFTGNLAVVVSADAKSYSVTAIKMY